MTEIIKITDHEAAAVARLLTQYKDKPNFEGIIRSIVEQYQDAEDATFDLIAGRALLTAEGQQLDNLGTIVGVERQGFDDDFYRTLIFVQIGKNTSQGEPEKLITILQLLTAATRVLYVNLNFASVQLLTDGIITDEQVNFTYDNMEEIAAGGVRIDHILCYTDNTFAFQGNNPLAPGLGLGDSDDSNVGGFFATLHKKTVPFAFSGNSVFAEGFGSLDDPLAGGNLE